MSLLGSIGELVANITADISGFVAGLNDAVSKGREAGTKIASGIQDGLGPLNNGDPFRGFKYSLDEVQAKLLDLGEGFLKTGTAVSAISIPIALLGKEAIETAAKFEQTEIAFTHFLGSTRMAKSYLSDLYTFAATTPFQIGDVTKGAQSLMAMGTAAKDIIPEMRIIGDQLSAVGRMGNFNRVILALGEMSHATKGYGMQLRELLQDAAIPAKEYLADAFNIPMSKIDESLKKGLIPGAAAVKAILAGMARDTGGLTSEQMSSFSGQMSNIKDQITITLAEIGEQLLPYAKIFASFAAVVLEKIKELAAWFGRLPEPVKAFIATFLALTAAAGPVLVVIGGIALALAVVEAPILLVTGAIIVLVSAFAALGTWVYSNWIPIVNVINAGANNMKLGIQGLYDFITKGKAFTDAGRQDLRKVWDESQKGLSLNEMWQKGAANLKGWTGEAKAAADAARRLAHASEGGAAGETGKHKPTKEERDQIANRDAYDDMMKRYQAQAEAFGEYLKKIGHLNEVYVQSTKKLNAEMSNDSARLHEKMAQDATKAIEVTKGIPEPIERAVRLTKALAAAFDYLGIDSVRKLNEEYAKTVKAYELLRSTGVATAEELSRAWIAMEEARQRAAESTGQKINASERLRLSMEKDHQFNKRNGGFGENLGRNSMAAFGDSFNSGIQGMLNGTKTFRSAWGGMVQSMYQSWTATIAQMTAQWAMMQIKKLAIHVLTNSGIVASNAATASASHAISLREHLKEIFMAAKKAAANAFASAMKLPVPINAIVAPIAAVGAFAGVMALGLVSAQAGADLPNRETIGMLHPREMVLPREYADVIRGLASNNAGNASGQQNHFHGPMNYHAPKGESFSEKAWINMGTKAMRNRPGMAFGNA